MPRRDRGPGPGAYNVPLGFTQSKAYTMRIRPETQKVIDMTPGPAEYEPKTTHALKASAKWGFGTSKRNPMGRNAAPGPGEYTPQDPIHMVSPRACFGTSLRAQEGSPKKNYTTPGPGTYNPLRVKDTVHLSATIGGSRDDAAIFQNQGPGPAAYNQNARIQSRMPPAFGFGTASRVTGAGKSSMANPGPGSYESKPTFHGPKITITPRREPYDDF